MKDFRKITQRIQAFPTVATMWGLLYIDQRGINRNQYIQTLETIQAEKVSSLIKFVLAYIGSA